MLQDIWDFILELIAQVVIPVWNDLIQYIPLLSGMLGLALIVGLAWVWQRNMARNRSRVPRPIPAGRKPEDMHLPGPSLWPFVAPVGLLLIVFAVAIGPFETIFNIAVLTLGILVALLGIVGWYADANREYAQVEAGGHGGAGGTQVAQLPGWAQQPPEGTHLPGPSAWPFLAPLGLAFMVAGLIFGPIMLVGGLVMAAIAVIGWLADANRELEDVEAHGHPTQADRDPEKAWPRRLIPVYVFVGAAAIVLTLAPWLLSLFPGGGG